MHCLIKKPEQWLRHSERADFIKRQFGEQLMILYIIANSDCTRAKVFSDQYFESFLDEWSAMNVLSEKVRINKLMDARRVAEIHKYADFLNVESLILQSKNYVIVGMVHKSCRLTRPKCGNQ